MSVGPEFLSLREVRRAIQTLEYTAGYYTAGYDLAMQCRSRVPLLFSP